MPDRDRYAPLDSAVTPRYAGIPTFLRAAAAPVAPDLDIALAGLPLDTGATFRSGARHGPEGVRSASRLIRQVNPATGIAPFRLCNLADVGDAPTDPLSVERSVARAEPFFRAIAEAGAVPVVIGGDHTVPLPVLRGIVRAGPVGLLQVDAHSDTFDSFMGSAVNHATFLRRAIEEGLVDPARTIQVGLRGTRYGADDLGWARAAGIRLVTMDEYEEMGRAAVLAEIRRVTGAGPVYVTIDIDGLDPTEAPGTGVPEPGGVRMRDLQVILRGLTGMRLAGGDVCEVVPGLDPAGLTCLNAANLMFELACLAAASHPRRRG